MWQDGLTLEIGGLVLQEDNVNPISPDGWWDAVSHAGDRCLVAVVRSDALDLNAPDTRARFLDLLHEPEAGACALLPVVHGPWPHRAE